MHKNLNKKIKKMDVWDLKLVKLSTASFVLFVLSIWPAALTWIGNTSWWWFLAATIIFAWRPIRKVCC